jgi:hypothetical protein
LQSLLHDEPARARVLLRQLIVGRLELVADADRLGDTFTGTGTVVPLLSGVLPALASLASQIGTSPTGLVNPWCPRLTGWMGRAS